MRVTPVLLAMSVAFAAPGLSALAEEAGAFDLEGFTDVEFETVPREQFAGPGEPDWDHLEPGNPGAEFPFQPVNRFTTLVNGYLGAARAGDVRLHVVVYPSFAPEYAAGILRVSGQARIFRLESREQLWSDPAMWTLESGTGQGLYAEVGFHETDELRARMKAAYPAVPADVPLSHCERSVPQGLAAAIEGVWARMVRGARASPQPSWVLDGVTYLFSMHGGGGREGYVWSPPGGSRTDRLVRVADLMSDYCRTQEPDAVRAKLEDEVAALAEALDAAGEPAAAP
jgi:hypothetical protein